MVQSVYFAGRLITNQAKSQSTCPEISWFQSLSLHDHFDPPPVQRTTFIFNRFLTFPPEIALQTRSASTAHTNAQGIHDCVVCFSETT